MKRIEILLLLFSILLISCGSNVFFFDEETQEIIAVDTYFSCIIINELYGENTYKLKCSHDSEKTMRVNLVNIQDDFEIVNLVNYDTLKRLPFKENTKYEIINRGIYDAAACKIILETDSLGVLHECGKNI